jgi:PAS domain S-box-containing protein
MKRSNIKKIENINLITNDTEFYKSIFDSSLQNKVIVENGIIIEINDKALENISSRKENVIGKKLSHYFPHLQPDGEQSLIKSRRIFKQVVQNKINQFSWKILNPPNKNYEIEVNLNYIRYNNRKFFVYNFFFVQSNTNFDFHLNRIRNSYNFFIDFFTDAAIIHKKGVLITCNVAAAQILEANTIQELNNYNLFSLLLPEYLNKAAERLAIVEKGGNVTFSDFKIKTLKNNIKTVELKSLSINQIGKDEILMLVREVIENTDLLEKEIFKNKELENVVKQLQEVLVQKYDTQIELTNSQRVVRSIINSSIDIIIASDENGIISEFNNAAQNVFGYKKEEVIGKSIAILYAGPEEKIKVNNALLETGFFSGEILNKRKDGEIFTSYLSLSEMVNETNSFIGRVGVSRDITVEKIQQQKLIDSEERYRNIVESTSDLIFSFTLNGKFIFTNNSFSNSLGYSIKELENTTINEIIHPESLATFSQHIKKIVVADEQVNVELPFVKKDRKLLIAQGILSCKKNEKNDFVFLASFKNISEQKLAEEKIKLSEERYKAVFAQEFLGIAILDVFGRIQQLNNTFCHVLGYTEREMLLMNIIDLTHPEDKEKTTEINRLFLNLKQTKITEEKRLIHKLGSVVYGNESWSVVSDNKGNPDYFILFFEDITEKKIAQRKFLQQSAKLKAIFQSTSQSIITVNSNYELTSFNDYFSKGYKNLSGLEPQENLKILEFLLLILGKEQAKAFKNYHQRALLGIPQQFEKSVSLPNGQTIWLDFYIDPIIVPDKPIDEASYIVHDITDKKLNEDQIKQSLQEKEILLKEVHHRVKNNLQVISSILNLQSHYIKDEAALETLKEIQNRIKSMALIHENLYQNKDLSHLNFGEYIANLVQNLVYTYNSSKKEIEVLMDVDDIFLNLDYSIPCGLIINELISNSLKHAFTESEKGTIKVIFKKHTDLVHLSIEDDGKGFNKKIDFRNTDSLGLQLVMALVDQINGKIEQKAQTKKGTIYTIEFKYDK